MDFRTRKALNKYMKEHPKGKRSNHRVVKNITTPRKARKAKKPKPNIKPKKPRRFD